MASQRKTEIKETSEVVPNTVIEEILSPRT
jgi:hypothetical protein